MSELEDQWSAERRRAAEVMARDFPADQLPMSRETATTRTPFPYWISCSTPDLIASADEYERAVNEGRFADDPDAGVRLLATAADIRTEIARRVNEHWHPGSILHSHPGGKEPHEHEEPPPMTAHLHRAGGQTLRHSHADGDKPHGYYGHPEDAARPDLVRIARDRDCPGCGYPETVAVGRLLVGADLYECNRRPPCGWRTDGTITDERRIQDGVLLPSEVAEWERRCEQMGEQSSGKLQDEPTPKAVTRAKALLDTRDEVLPPDWTVRDPATGEVP